MGALADEAVVHHQERIDGLLHAGGAERMAGERLGGRDRRAFLARPEDLADRLDLLLVADGGRGGVRVDVVDGGLHVLERHAHAAHRALAGRRHHVVTIEEIHRGPAIRFAEALCLYWLIVLLGFGLSSDSYDMVAPVRRGRGTLHAHGARDREDSRRLHQSARHLEPVGDLKEIEAIREVFGSGDKCPPISATESSPAIHSGATGVQEAIYSLLMMNNGLVCESAHIEEIDPAVADMNIVRRRIGDARIDTVLSNSFGFGGTNATLVFSRYNSERATSTSAALISRWERSAPSAHGPACRF